MRIVFTLLIVLTGDESAGRLAVGRGGIASAVGWAGPSLPTVGGVDSNLCPLGSLTPLVPLLHTLAGLGLFLVPPGSGAMSIEDGVDGESGSSLMTSSCTGTAWSDGAPRGSCIGSTS